MVLTNSFCSCCQSTFALGAHKLETTVTGCLMRKNYFLHLAIESSTLSATSASPSGSASFSPGPASVSLTSHHLLYQFINFLAPLSTQQKVRSKPETALFYYISGGLLQSCIDEKKPYPAHHYFLDFMQTLPQNSSIHCQLVQVQDDGWFFLFKQ